MYSIHIDERTGAVSVVRDRDGARIPKDVRNGDYAEFVAWNAEQAEPLDVTDREPPPPVKSPEELATDYMAKGLEERTPAWDALLAAAMVWVLLKFVQDQPDQAQAVLDAAGIDYKLRGAK